MSPRTSVIICTHQMRETLPGAIASVREQTTADWEIVILDDASTDGTWEYLTALASSQIRVFRNRQRLGVVKSRNRLLREARGEFFSVLDADDRFFPDKLERHAAVLTARAEVGVVWGRAEVVRGDGITSVPEPGFVPGWDIVAPYRVIHSATTWRRAALLSVGGYDESLYCEEAPDAFLRVGDHFLQHFDDGLAARKHLAVGTEFRKYWEENQREISASLLLKTLTRRYGLNKGPLVERIKLRMNDKGLHERQ